jgi:predicted metalloprotease with PDZ domain
MHRSPRLTLCLAAFLAAAPLAFSQAYVGPQPVPLPPPVADPVEKPYPGTIHLSVDIADTARRVIQVRETIPVSGTDLTLLYPQWIPGTHSPTGPISKMAGLVVTANGHRIDWVRDRVNIFAFHIPVPEGTKSVDVAFQFLPPLSSAGGREGRVSFSSKIIDLAWNTVVLYPAGYFARSITFSPSIRLPKDWHFASALELDGQKGDVVKFKDTTFNTLVDSPLYAGINYKRIDLSTGSDNPVYLDVFGDEPGDLAITPEELQLHRNLTQQAQALYASHHYNHYDFLLTLSDEIGGNGLEHHQSSEDGQGRDYFTDWAGGVGGRDLLGHEYNHSWDGKFRRPADLWTANFDVPMQDDLLWVYEGMTEYYGFVLTARSGMRTAEQTRDMIALITAGFEISPGRTWRPLVDTTNQPTISQRSAVSWVSWQRPEDYYTEGMLIWLDADTKIRELSGGKKSLDDFAKLFFGIDNGSFITRTYTLDDIVDAMNKTQAYDWAGFFKTRVYDLAPAVPEDGITRGGYKLTYTDKQQDWLKRSGGGARGGRGDSFGTSLGFSVGPDGTISNVSWDSIAFKAGIAPGIQLMAVNDLAYSGEHLRAAIVDAEKGKDPIRLLFKKDGAFLTYSLDYHGGLRYPRLDRVDGTPARLDDILAAVK